MFGLPDGSWPVPSLAYIRGGLTIENCFIKADITQPPNIYFIVEGGDVTIRNNIIVVRSGISFLNAHDLGPYPLTLLDVRDNTVFASDGLIAFYINGSPPIPGPVRFINNIFQASSGIDIDCANGAMATVSHNDFYAPSWYIDCTSDSTNLFVDPMLCEPHFFESVPDDFGLEYGSPCVGAGENGTTIGALEVLCGIPAAVGGGAAPSRSPLLLDVAPNPLVAAGGLVTLGLEAGVPATLRLYGASGRLELARRLGATGGVMRLTLGEALGARVARGSHFLELSQGRHRAVRKLVVLE